MIPATIRDGLLSALRIPLHGSVICLVGATAFECKTGEPEASPDLDAVVVQLGSCTRARKGSCNCWPLAQGAIDHIRRGLQLAAQSEAFAQLFTEMGPVSEADLLMDSEYRQSHRRGEIVAGGRAWLGHLTGGYLDKFVLIARPPLATTPAPWRLLEVCTASDRSACKYRRSLTDLAWSDMHAHWYESDARQCESLRASLRHKSDVLADALRSWSEVSPSAAGARYRAELLKPNIDAVIAKVTRVARRLRSFGGGAASFVAAVDESLAAPLAEYASSFSRVDAEATTAASAIADRRAAVALAVGLAEVGRRERDMRGLDRVERASAKLVASITAAERARQVQERADEHALGLRSRVRARACAVVALEQERARRMRAWPIAHPPPVPRAQLDGASVTRAGDLHPARGQPPVAEEEAERARRMRVDCAPPAEKPLRAAGAPPAETPLRAAGAPPHPNAPPCPHSVEELMVTRARMSHVWLLRHLCRYLQIEPHLLTDIIFGRQRVVQVQTTHEVRDKGGRGGSSTAALVAVTEFCVSDATTQLPNMRTGTEFLISIAGRLDALADTIEALPPSDTRTTCTRLYIFVGNWMCWLAEERISCGRREFIAAGRQIACGTEPRTRELFKTRAAALPQAADCIAHAFALTRQLRPQFVRSRALAAAACWAQQELWQHLARATLEYVHMTKLELHAEGDALLVAVESLRLAHGAAARKITPAENFAAFKKNMLAIEPKLQDLFKLLPIAAAGWFEPPPRALCRRQLVIEWTDRCISNFRCERFDKLTVGKETLLLFHLADGAIGDIVECLTSVRAIRTADRFQRWISEKRK